MQSETQGKTDPSKEGGDASMANLWWHTGEENVRHVSGRQRAEETKMQHFLKTMTNINPRNSGLSNRINTKTINTNNKLKTSPKFKNSINKKNKKHQDTYSNYWKSKMKRKSWWQPLKGFSFLFQSRSPGYGLLQHYGKKQNSPWFCPCFSLVLISYHSLLPCFIIATLATLFF